MATIDWEPIPTISLDLGEKLDIESGPIIHICTFYLKIKGDGEIFHGYRTYITMPTIDSDPISTIWLDLGEKLA